MYNPTIDNPDDESPRGEHGPDHGLISWLLIILASLTYYAASIKREQRCRARQFPLWARVLAVDR